MKLRLLAVGTRLPEWMAAGVEEYRRRLPKLLGFELQELKSGRAATVERSRKDEADRLLGRIGQDDLVVALDERGQQWSTRDLAGRLGEWRDDSARVALLIGGADGLDESCRERASHTWALSRATLPHGLARVVAVEQLYRAWSLLNNHPYHRG
ncbi:MAG: 23S rRNA (pseudouridine(1915)-N(3))-methyltransferase RlmH [Pseudomonadota bacterium]